MIRYEMSAEELVSRWEDRRAVQNVLGILSQHFLIKEEKHIVADLWSAGEDVTLGVNEGFYVGKAAVEGYFDALYQRDVIANRILRGLFPDKLGDKTEAETQGIGSLNYFPLDTPVVEVADDGQTAKGIWALRNTYSAITPRGPESYWQWGWVAADLRKEDGGWKIWHLLILDDAKTRAGVMPGRPYEEYPELPEFGEMKAWRLPEPTVARAVRPRYSVDRPFTPPPRLPEPYDTFENTFSYGEVEA